MHNFAVLSPLDSSQGNTHVRLAPRPHASPSLPHTQEHAMPALAMNQSTRVVAPRTTVARPAKRGPAPAQASSSVSFTSLNGGGAAGRSPYTDELRATAKYIAQRGKGM